MVAGVISSIASGRPGAPEAGDREDPDIHGDSACGAAGDGPRHARVGARFASGGGRRPAGLAWLVLVTAVLVAGAGAFGIARLQGYAAQRHELRTMLADIRSSAWQQSALKWQATADSELTPTLAREHNESHLVAHALAVQLERRDPDSAETRAVQAAFDSYYHGALEREFELLAHGRVDDAKQVDEEQVDPAFERLMTALTSADRAYGVRAAEASAQARLGTILILAATAMITGGLVRLQRAGSQAYGRVAHRASHDQLTGLPNRSLLHERTAEAIRHAARKQSMAALLLIDLDRFKEVNDTLGHHCGDELLIQVAGRMQGALRHGDTVARLGGDEFAILLPHVATNEDVAAAAARLGTALEAPFLLNGLSLTVDASVGAALYPEHAGNADELLQRADIAMYVAKTSNTDFVVFDSSLGHSSLRSVRFTSSASNIPTTPTVDTSLAAAATTSM
jgi:diguanylate cyclase (GGDEF)-like protein